jgi:arginine exporter protein ArgO
VFVVVVGGTFTCGVGAGLLLQAIENNSKKINIENKKGLLIITLHSGLFYYIINPGKIKDINAVFGIGAQEVSYDLNLPLAVFSYFFYSLRFI